jgi:adenosylcobinamide kinase / adenosylcobinamide-phosphate guanylyltransferase
MGARTAGIRRQPGEVIVAGALTIMPGTGPLGATADGSGCLVQGVPGGWDIAGPDGTRLLVAAGPGQVPDPPGPARPADVALLDLLTSPAQLGQLRARGIVHERTRVVALYCDHRIGSERELERRCGLWAAVAGVDGLRVTGPAGPPAPPVRPHRTLLLGGARSGKSAEAELRLSGEPSVTYVAAGPWPEAATADAAGAGGAWTGPDGQPDAEWASRIAAHRASRPGWWRTEESLDLAGLLRRHSGALLIDGIGTWLAAIMADSGAWSDPPAVAGESARVIAARIDELVQAWRQTSAMVVAVTDQVGSGLVPAYPAGRQFRDQLGWLNQRLAAESELTVLVTAGRPMELPR